MVLCISSKLLGSCNTDRPDIDTISDMVDSIIQTDNKLTKQIKLYFRHRDSGLEVEYPISPSSMVIDRCP